VVNVNRVSALDGHIKKGRFGAQGAVGVHLTLVEDLRLQQVAAWPTSIGAVGGLAADSINASAAAGPGQSVGSATQAMLRVEPLKWWLIGTEPLKVNPQLGASLDLSHSRTRLRITGSESALLLNRLLPLDLRQQSFPAGSVASSAIHHVGVTLWHNDLAYELFIPRGFALSIWEVIFNSALQFGVEVN